MNTPNDNHMCSLCGENPAVASALISTPSGEQEDHVICESCIQEQMGEAWGSVQQMLQNMFGPMLGGESTRPNSHPSLDPVTRDILALSMALAVQANSSVTDTQHLIVAMIASEAGRAGLRDNGIDEAAIARFHEAAERLELLGEAPAPLDKLHPAGPSAKAALRAAQGIAASARSRTVEPGHLWQGIVATAEGTAMSLLKEGLGKGYRPGQNARTSTPALDKFSRDLTHEAREGRIDPVIGRHHEIQQIIEILSRRRKNNAAIIGSPGVGKTALVEGLALRIVNGDIPETMEETRVVELDMAAMVAGTQYRGQFEERLKTVLSEAQANQGHLILFLDELHTLVGAGGAEGAMDAAQMLKPMLARGDLQLIGATTLAEYRRIEKDGALARRFSPVYIDEPSVEETITILKGLKDGYEAHHGILIDDDAIRTAARLADRYLFDNHMPDKAIDLLDQAGARLRLSRSIKPEGLRELQEQLDSTDEEMVEAAHIQDFERAASLKTKAQELQTSIDNAREAAGAGEDGDVPRLSPEDIIDVLSRKTGIPVGELGATEMEKLREIDKDLHKRVVGQEAAIQAVSDIIRNNRIGFRSGRGPIGSFLFLGPTGVGKTETAKTLAERLFASEDALIRLDMSEFHERHQVSRLIGSPPGYVGYGEGGQLTEAVRRKPYSVILLDEIEKAHPDVWNILLGVLDDGRLTDGEGRTVDFSNAIIIMTSNLGASAAAASRPLGFTAQNDNNAKETAITDALKATFPPELRNRIDEIVIFQPLTKSNIENIAHLMVDRIIEAAAESHELSLTVSQEIISKLAHDGFDADMGARPLQRHLRRTVEKAITDALLDGRISRNDNIELVIDGDDIGVDKRAVVLTD